MNGGLTLFQSKRKRRTGRLQYLRPVATMDAAMDSPELARN
jgi:hypothetical protein